MLSYTVLFTLAGLLCVGLGLHLTGRRIAPNRWLGFRLPARLNDPEFWYQSNGYIGKWLVLTGSCLAVAAVALHGLSSLGVEAQRWVTADGPNGATVFQMVTTPVGVTESLIFCLPLLALCGLQLLILAFPSLFWKKDRLSTARSASAEEKRVALDVAGHVRPRRPSAWPVLQGQ